MAYLIVLRNHAVVCRRELTDAVTIGRSPDCDVVIDDPRASRQHCAIGPSPVGGWRVRDLGSRNGTLKGDAPVTECELTNGDVLWLGENVCVQFGEGPMPGRRPRHPHEALEFARVEAGEEKRSPEAPMGPRPMPRAWDSPDESSPADASAVSTDLNFGAQPGTARRDAARRTVG
jgi:predicted component of type VI protein secretion system